MKILIASLYQNLKIKGNQILYLSSIMAVTLAIVLHIFQLVILFDIPSIILNPAKIENQHNVGWINAAIVMTPIIILVLVIFPQKKTEKGRVERSKAEKISQAFFILLYGFLLLLFALLIYKGIISGNI